jgi:tryptophan-rich sensory protein
MSIVFRRKKMKKIVLLALVVFVVVLGGGILLENVFPSISSLALEIIMSIIAALIVIVFGILTNKKNN